MPVEWRLHVLEERLKRDYGEVFTIGATDLYGLSPREQSAALNAMIEVQGQFPVVLVNEVAVCVGDIDVDAIAAEVGRRIGKAS
jgi:hypothetical protein